MRTVQRKKIVYLIATLRVGGSEQQLIDTAIRINRKIFEPKLYCLCEGGHLQSIAEQHGVKVTTFKTDPHKTLNSRSISFRRPREFFSLYRYLQQERPDIVHCYMYKPSIYGGLAARLMKKPILLTNRRCLGFFKDGKPYYQVLENIVNRFTDGVLVNSQALKEDVLCRENISPDKVHLIHNGVDIQKYTITDKNVEFWVKQKKQELGIPEKAPVIGMVANLFPYKGYHDFIMAASEVHRSYPEARFLCIGEDWGIQRQLEKLSSQLGIRDNLLFTGYVPDIPKMLHGLNIQVSASHEEGFSNAILEGMASGKPIIATAVGGTPEAILDKSSGLLVPPKVSGALADAITALLKNPDFAAQLGANARKRVEEHFSMEKMLDKLEKLYLKLIS